MAGRIVAGPHVRNACRRHLDDLEKGPARGLSWDLAAARRALDFFPDVLRLAQGKFEGQRFSLHPSQEFIIGSLFGWKGPNGFRRFRRAYIEVAKGNGKALALDTPIPTPAGWTTMGDLRDGDVVLDDGGRPCRVVRAHEIQMGRPCFRVVFDDGAAIVADAEHLWRTERRNGGTERGARLKGVPKEQWGGWRRGLRTTFEIAATLRYSNGAYRSANHSVALAGPLELPEADLPVAPYVLGYWLGDGDSDASRVTIGDSDAAELLAELRKEGIRVGTPKVCGAKNGSRYWLHRLNPLLRTLGVLHNKHIPACYLRASRSQRLAILQGLMDTDGYISRKGQCEFSVCNQALAEGAAELITSLGIKCTSNASPATLRGMTVGQRWRVSFFPPADMPMFRLQRKAMRQGARHTRRRLAGDRRIVSCDPVESVAVRCITVDSASGMFLAGRQMVPTHNSPLAAGIGMYCLVADGEAQAEVYAGASMKSQAMVIFRAAVMMWRQSPALSARLTPSGGNPVWNLADLRTGSFFKPISTDEAHSGPMPSCALLDELHEHRDSNMLEMLERGFKSRRQPLLIMITNSGSDRQSVCWDEHKHAVAVAAGTRTPDDEATYVGEVIDDSDSSFSYVCSIDKDDDFLEDETCWVKANPLLGVSQPVEEVRRAVAQAKAIPGRLNNVLRLHGCVWTDADTAWMSRATLESCLDEFDPEAEHEGERVFVGADLSATRDLTALAFVVPTGFVDMPREDGGVARLPTFDAWAEAWTPRDDLHERSLRDNMPYDIWADEGHLNAVPGKVVRFDFVAARLAELSSVFRIEAVAYDRYGFKRLFEPALDEMGLTLPIVEHPQGGKRRAAESGLWMPGSKAALEAAILDGRIRLRRSPVLISAMMSAVVEEDPYGNAWFSKRHAVNRIDALVALAMAVGAATSAEPPPRSLYEDPNAWPELMQAAGQAHQVAVHAQDEEDEW